MWTLSVPSLYTVEADGCSVTEAILDVVASHPGGLCKAHVDVTIRAPHAVRYEHAYEIPGVAASAGEFEKLDRYGAQVLPLSFEPSGRLGAASAKNLRSLAMNAATFRSTAAGAPPSLLYSRWRAELERVLAYEMADICLLCLGHSSGLHGLRRQRQQLRRQRQDEAAK